MNKNVNSFRFVPNISNSLLHCFDNDLESEIAKSIL